MTHKTRRRGVWFITMSMVVILAAALPASRADGTPIKVVEERLEKSEELPSGWQPSDQAREAIEELLVVARREHLSPEDVADRLEMVGYFHRDLLEQGAREWITRLFEHTFARAASADSETHARQTAIQTAERAECALRIAAHEISEMIKRTQVLQHSLMEGTPLADRLRESKTKLLVNTMTKTGRDLAGHSVRLARAEVRLLAQQGCDASEISSLLEIPRHLVDSFMGTEEH